MSSHLHTLFVAAIAMTMGNLSTAAPVPADAATAEKLPLDKLIEALEANDGDARVVATKELFRRDKAVLAGLKAAGATQVAPTRGTINTRRIDIVYSLIEGLPPNAPKALAGYSANSFGLRLEDGTTADDITRMGKAHGFKALNAPKPDSVPSVYVQLTSGGKLADVLRKVLITEPKVVSVNLNYFEK
jgi:hypothetical protein